MSLVEVTSKGSMRCCIWGNSPTMSALCCSLIVRIGEPPLGLIRVIGGELPMGLIMLMVGEPPMVLIMLLVGVPPIMLIMLLVGEPPMVLVMLLVGEPPPGLWKVGRMYSLLLQLLLPQPPSPMPSLPESEAQGTSGTAKGLQYGIRTLKAVRGLCCRSGSGNLRRGCVELPGGSGTATPPDFRPASNATGGQSCTAMPLEFAPLESVPALVKSPEEGPSPGLVAAAAALTAALDAAALAAAAVGGRVTQQQLPPQAWMGAQLVHHGWSWR
eukprot:scaffold110500_cov16-Tisochrysis_lutea.AAC.1